MQEVNTSELRAQRHRQRYGHGTPSITLTARSGRWGSIGHNPRRLELEKSSEVYERTSDPSPYRLLCL